MCIEANGLVHRDLKPENVLFSQDGTAKLADLGIVRFSRPGSKADVHKTRAEAVVGTPAYMSPEQMLDSHAVDIRSDIYSLGIISMALAPSPTHVSTYLVSPGKLKLSS